MKDEEEDEKYYADRFVAIRYVLAQISDMLRPIKSQSVLIQPLCDTLWLYARIETYFTPNQNYSKCKGEELKIRKCDVRNESN